MSSGDKKLGPGQTLQGKFIVEMFPEELVEFNKEVGKHPLLMEALAKLETKDFYTMLAKVAIEVGVVLDDTYTLEDIRKVCDICTERLKRRRTGIVSDLRH